MSDSVGFWIAGEDEWFCFGMMGKLGMRRVALVDCSPAPDEQLSWSTFISTSANRKDPL